MDRLVLAHGLHFTMFLFPVAAAVCLMIAMRDTPKRRNPAMPVLPTNPWSRQIRSALRPPKTHPGPPAPEDRAPSSIARRTPRRGRSDVPLHRVPPPPKRPSDPFSNRWSA